MEQWLVGLSNSLCSGIGKEMNNNLPSTVAIEASGIKYIVFDAPDLIVDNIKAHGGYEAHIVEICHALLSDEKEGIVLDIGSNIGTFCLPLAKNNPNLLFLAYEPQRIIYYQLCGNVFFNSLDNIYPFPFGLSSKDDLMFIEMPDYTGRNNIGAFSLDPEVRKNDGECRFSDRREQVHLKMLDSLQLSNIKLIKIDVEGLEKEVILGGLQTLLNNDYPPIIFEAWTYKPWYQERRKELYNMLEKLGYQISVIGENNIAQHHSRIKFEFKIVNNQISWTSVEQTNN